MGNTFKEPLGSCIILLYNYLFIVKTRYGETLLPIIKNGIQAATTTIYSHETLNKHRAVHT